MKKVIRLTEDDLMKIVKKVINEQNDPVQEGGSMQAFVKVENGKKYIYFESEMNPGKTKKYGPVAADHLKDKEHFQVKKTGGKLFGKGKEIKKL
jgi:hypothetical protein